MTLIFISSENVHITLEAPTRSDMIAKIKGWYGFMNLTGRNLKGEDDAFSVFGNGYHIGTVSRL